MSGRATSGRAPNQRTRPPRVAFGLAWLAFCGLGCGARAADAPADEENLGTAGAGAAGDRGGPARGGSGDGSGAASTLDPGELGEPSEPRFQLPACQPGFAMSGGRECGYTFEGDCYEDEVRACACACEGLADSRCVIQGFLNPDEPQRVSCVER